MISIGTKEVLLSATVMVPDGEEAYVPVPIIGDQALNLSLTFVPGDGSVKNDASWLTEADRVKFTFTGWTSAIGTAVEPQKFGDVGNRKLYFQLAHRRIGHHNLVHVFVLLGAADE